MRFHPLAIVAAGLLLTVSLGVAQATETLTGTVIDTMCGRKHMMKGKSDAECTRECVRQGSDYALVVGDKAYTLRGDKTLLDKWAGQSVTVHGALSGNTINVKAMSAK